MLAQITSDSLEIVRKKTQNNTQQLETIKRSYALSGVSFMQGGLANKTPQKQRYANREKW